MPVQSRAEPAKWILKENEDRGGAAVLENRTLCTSGGEDAEKERGRVTLGGGSELFWTEGNWIGLCSRPKWGQTPLLFVLITNNLFIRVLLPAGELFFFSCLRNACSYSRGEESSRTSVCSPEGGGEGCLSRMRILVLYRGHVFS